MENNDSIIKITDKNNRNNNRRKNEKCRIFWSIITILSVAISTGYGSQVKYSLLNDDPKHFFAPYTMMWFNNCCLIICFPLFLFYEKLIKKNQLSLREITSKSARIFSDEGFRFGPFFLKEIFFLCLYAFGNYSYALSLGKISSSAALTIRSFEVSVVYIFGRLVLKDNFNIFKTIAVFLAMIGVLLIALDKEFAANIIGFILVLLSCLSDSIYKVTFKLVSGDEASLGEGMLFLSGMALVNLPLNFLPTALLVHFGYDIWQWNYIPWGNFLNFVFLTFVFNIATIFGVAALGPLSIVIGILCGIPISICIDVILRGRHLTPIFVIGALSLVISAILANFHKQIGDLIKLYLSWLQFMIIPKQTYRHDPQTVSLK